MTLALIFPGKSFLEQGGPGVQILDNYALCPRMEDWVACRDLTTDKSVRALRVPAEQATSLPPLPLSSFFGYFKVCCCFVLFYDRVSSCNPGCPQTHVTILLALAGMACMRHHAWFKLFFVRLLFLTMKVSCAHSR